MSFFKRSKPFLLLVFLLIVLLIHQAAGFDAYAVDETYVSDGKLHLSVVSANSSACITGYKYRVKGNAIELKVFAGGTLLHSPEDYAARLDIVIPLAERLRNQDIEIRRGGLFGGEILKTITANDAFQ